MNHQFSQSPYIKTLALTGLVLMPVFIYLMWNLSSSPITLSLLPETYQGAGTSVKQDFQSLPTLPITQTDDTYQIEDTLSDGINIQYANHTEGETSLGGETSKTPLTLSFPKDYEKPIEVKLDRERTIPITDLSGKSDYQVSTLSEEAVSRGDQPGFFQRLFTKKDDPKESYLRYTSRDGRKELLYAYQKDQATGEKKLKHWTLYQQGDGLEQEEYQFENAKVRVTEAGVAEVFYYGDRELKNDQVAAEVDSNLMERAQRTLAKEMGEDLMNGGRTPDFTIPKPYFIDNQGNKHDAEWKWHEETKSLSVSFSPESYPVALDPTLQFTAPGQSNTGDVITGGASSNSFGTLISGDFNADGRIDLAIGASGYSTNTGRVYLFYNDSSLPATAATADVIITGAANSNFGDNLQAGDIDADGDTDLIVFASYLQGYVLIYYNDGSYPITLATADITIIGENMGEAFGGFMAIGDFNADGKIDLAATSQVYSTATGRTYIFYNDGSIPTTAATADAIITGATTLSYMNSLAAGDFNADGKTDLAIGAYGTPGDSYTGKVYVFYNGAITTESVTGADITITGSSGSYFGFSLTAGDFNADGRTDLVVGGQGYSTNTGRAYIFYNDGSIPTTAGTADVTITGETTSNYFSSDLTAGDFNADGRTDLVVGAYGYSSSTGRAYIFYNDGSIPTTAATADMIVTGEASSLFGSSLDPGDFNADGKTDLVVGAHGYATNTGRAYILYSQNGQVNTNQSITGETTSNNFGQSLVTGDFNADGRTDLAVGAHGYSTSTGRVYIFYGDGQIPSTAATADVTITGETTSNFFGYNSLAAGDFNADGKTDLAVGAYGYSTNTGRAYIFYGDGSIPTTAATADVIITGETTSNVFGIRLLAGDFNADGKTDLAVGASAYSGDSGRAYIFYNDGSIPTTAGTADVTISGESTSYFGSYMTAGDFNTDSRVDLVIGAYGYSSYGNTGRAYIFYNDGSIPTTAATADVTITGETTSNSFGAGFAAGDFNSDGRTDLAIGASGYSTNTGRAYIFYNDGSIPTTAATADVTITGETTSNYFGYALAAGDFNADGRTDLAVGAYSYSTNIGRAYIFHNDGSIPTTAATADVTITGETTNNYFGFSLAGGDMNADGRTDLIVGAHGNSSSTGKVYLYETRENFAWQIQKQPGTTPRTNTNGTGQELKITGEAGSGFGTVMTTGDMNSDGKPDLIVGARPYLSSTGRVYVFYSDGTLATGVTNADVVITGAGVGNAFGQSLVVGDWNADGRTDLAVGAVFAGPSGTGRAYVFYNDGSLPTTATTADVIITGASPNDYCGSALTSGDFNADGKTDLVVGASQGASVTPNGFVYVFYNGSITTESVSGADLTLTGGTSDYFGSSLTTGDFNADGKTDLAVGASSSAGRAYVFYNDGSIPTTAATADVTITGEANYFGITLTAGDMNADGRTDLIVGSDYSYNGRVYIFYNDGSIPTTAATADVTITGSGYVDFGSALAVGDFNRDSRMDLAVGGYSYYGDAVGKAYIFYNDGSIPTTSATADVTLIGETGSLFGSALTASDFNADGTIDLAVGARGYSSSAGRVYVYTLGNDPVITGGATSNYFGIALASGDFNSDGRVDLAVGAHGYSTNTGRVYLFYNDGNIPAVVASADVTITGDATGDIFGRALITGDFDASGTTDLAVGAPGYSSSTGRVYLFYSDGSIPTTAGTADVTITGNATSDQFGDALVAGDLTSTNSYRRDDLVVGAYGYSSQTGRVYIFHNDGSIPTTAATADVTITGAATNNRFGYEVVTGDLNSDGTTDLVVGTESFNGYTDRVYIFNNDGSIPTTAATADTTLTGVSQTNFGLSLAVGDFNADGRTDLAVGATYASSFTGSAYIFYNDGSMPTTAATADVTITGEATNNYFGFNLSSGDFNADGRTDLVVNSDYATNTGRAYLFYSDDSIPTTAATADVTITGEATNNYFGRVFVSGDFNADGRTDLAVSAYGYSTNTGRVYIYTSEVAAASVQTEPARVRGTVKTRGVLKVR